MFRVVAGHLQGSPSPTSARWPCQASASRQAPSAELWLPQWAASTTATARASACAFAAVSVWAGRTSNRLLSPRVDAPLGAPAVHKPRMYRQHVAASRSDQRPQVGRTAGLLARSMRENRLRRTPKPRSVTKGGAAQACISLAGVGRPIYTMVACRLLALPPALGLFTFLLVLLRGINEGPEARPCQ